ncbi:hypothetical protein XENOCAPTIV_020716, partial [Xenoophorus captivus]
EDPQYCNEEFCAYRSGGVVGSALPRQPVITVRERAPRQSLHRRSLREWPGLAVVNVMHWESR